MRRPERMYFAFGSNLHLGQMAMRCPNSRYIGIAQLQGYRFQINERGFANVVYSASDRVEGFLYLLSRTDEESLDRNEGVPTAYQKRFLKVDVVRASVGYVGRRVSEIAHQIQIAEPQITESAASMRPSSSDVGLRDSVRPRLNQKRGGWSSRIRHLGGGLKEHVADHYTKSYNKTTTKAEFVYATPHGKDFSDSQTTEALIYVSENFQQDGEPRREYIERMKAGIVDARKLGISDTYIDECLRPYLEYKRPSDHHATAQQPYPKCRAQLQDHSKGADIELPQYQSRYERGQESDNGWTDSYEEGRTDWQRYRL